MGVTMIEFAELVKKMPPNGLGELLRAITFVGEGLGGVENLVVRKGAQWACEQKKTFILEHCDEPPTEEEMEEFNASVAKSEIYTFIEGNLIVDAVVDLEPHEGNPVLAFRIRNGEKTIRFVENFHAKVENTWKEHTCESHKNLNPDWMK